MVPSGYDGELEVRATGNGFSVFATPTVAQARGAWYRYLRANKYFVTRDGGRFANDFDLVINPSVPELPVTAAESLEDARLLAEPYGGTWYGTIRLHNSLLSDS